MEDDQIKGDEAIHDTFLRRLLKIYWPMSVSNEEVHRRANTETISKLVRKMRVTWIGHVLRMDNSCLPRVALTWAPEGKLKGGRPKETRRRTVEKERMAMGFNSWVESGLAAANRVRTLKDHDFRPYSLYGEKELMMAFSENAKDCKLIA